MKHFEYQRGVGIPHFAVTGLAKQFLQDSLVRVEISDLTVEKQSKLSVRFLGTLIFIGLQNSLAPSLLESLSTLRYRID